jgi:hypothetical protein
MFPGLGFYSQVAAPSGPWTPASLGGSLIFAADPNDTTSAPDDGAGRARYLRHLYDTSKYIEQPNSGERPRISTGSGASGTKRVLYLGGPGEHLWMYTNTGVASPFTALINAFNSANPTSTGAATYIAAIELHASFVSFQRLGYWARLDGNGEIQIRQNTSNLGALYNGTSITTPQRSGWRLLTMIFGGGTIAFRVDGTQVGSTAITNAAAISSQQFCLGATSAADVVPPAQVGGLLVASAALSGTNLTNAEAWVKTTAGL